MNNQVAHCFATFLYFLDDEILRWTHNDLVGQLNTTQVTTPTLTPPSATSSPLLLWGQAFERFAPSWFSWPKKNFCTDVFPTQKLFNIYVVTFSYLQQKCIQTLIIVFSLQNLSFQFWKSTFRIKHFYNLGMNVQNSECSPAPSSESWCLPGLATAWWARWCGVWTATSRPSLRETFLFIRWHAISK